MGQSSRRLSPATLFMVSMNGIIGSGWLFAPYYAAKIAGSGAVISWIIGGLAVILISVTFAELSTMLPVTGGTAHIPQISHGAFASFILSWIAWVTALILAPIEVQAVLQYSALYFTSLMHVVDGVPRLTHIGYMWAALLMLSLCFVNVFSYRGLVRSNFILFVFKFTVIILTVFAIIKTKFIPANFVGMTDSVTTAHGWQAIFSAIATGGVIMAFNGFKNGVELAGEANKLSVAIPLSTAGSVLACLLLYLGLQVSFIGALDSSSIQNGWANLSFSGDIGPFVGLAAAIGLGWLLNLLYANAIISPLGAGLIYVTSTARILYAMSRIGYVPKFLSKLNKQRLPMYAIAVNFGLGMLSFLPLPGWQSMVNFMVSAMVITYAMGPIALLSLRLSLPENERPFRLPAARTLSLVAFYFCNLMSYWTGWETISKLSIMILVGIFLFALAYMRGSADIHRKELKSAIWIIPYLCGLVTISYFGSFGGKQIIPFGWDFLVIAVFSVIILCLAVMSRATLTSEEVAEYLFAESIALEQN